MANPIKQVKVVASKCGRTAQRFKHPPLIEIAGRLDKACEDIGEAWSGSWIGYHADMYLEGLRPRQPGEWWDAEWGGLRRFSNRTTGTWREYKFEEVQQEILKRAGSPKLDLIVQAAREAGAMFEESKRKLTAILDALLGVLDAKVLQQQIDKIEKLTSHTDASEVARSQLPRTGASRDSLALSQGIKAPHHVRFHAWLVEQFSYGIQVGELSQIARDVAEFLKQTQKMRGGVMPKPGCKVFIVHGHDEVMKREVQLLLTHANLDEVVLHEKPDKGRTIIDKLIEEGTDAGYAVALLSPDDAQNDGKARARQNVILEVGYFLGLLGKSKVRLLVKANVEIPSDLGGVLYQPYDENGAWKMKLLKEIKESGLDVDLDAVVRKL